MYTGHEVKSCPSDFSTVLICICRLPRSINVYEAKASVILAHLSSWNTHMRVDMHMETYKHKHTHTHFSIKLRISLAWPVCLFLFFS